MSVEAIVDVLKHANGLRAVQKYLGDKEVSSGVGWEQIQSNLQKHLDEGAITEDDLRDFVIDVHSRAHKLISLYKVSKKNHALLWEMAQELEGEVVESLEFPWLVDAQQLETLDDKPQRVYTRKTEKGYELFFTSARLGHEADDIPIEAIAKEEQAKYRNAAKMTVERIVRRQAFDVIFIPQDHAERIQIRIDTGNMAAKDRDLVRTHLEQIVLSSSRVPGTSFQPLNLFPAVRSIYDEDTEGQVAAIHFKYADGSLTHRIGRSPNGQRDLRRDPFHEGGAAKAKKKNMLVYFLSVELEDDQLKDPESVVVTLPGAVRHLNGAHLLAFEIEQFVSEATIAYAAGVIFEHVNKAS